MKAEVETGSLWNISLLKKRHPLAYLFEASNPTAATNAHYIFFTLIIKWAIF